MKFLLPTLLFLFLGYNQLAAQDLHTFALSLDGEEVKVTQDIDSRFMGYYLKEEGKKQWKYGLFDSEGSFYFTQTLSDPFNNEYDWDASKKTKIKWGVLVEDGKVVERPVQEYKNGQMTTYKAMVLVYQLDDTNETRDVLLYEKNGAFHLESTTKVNSSVASVID